MALTGLTTENFSLNSFQRHNAKLLNANLEICNRNNITEFEKLFDMADTYFEPEYPNVQNMDVLKTLIKCRYKHSQKLVYIHTHIQNRCYISTMFAVSGFMDLIKRLINCLEKEVKNGNYDKSIVEDIRARRKEINGILEVIDVLDKVDYWK